jgi:hypothetical protein
MRWAQLAFVEDDPGNYDQQFWLDYFRSVHADGACLSAGGVVAFYPTQIPLQQRSAWLGDRDAFGDLLAGCRAIGMNVIARTDAHASWQFTTRTLTGFAWTQAASPCAIPPIPAIGRPALSVLTTSNS